jgi:23S rRNA pseudouridine1911/1915/1917 synthase
MPCSPVAPEDRRAVREEGATVAFTADRGDASLRIDLALKRRLSSIPRWSRTRVQHLLASGGVAVNGRVVRRASMRLAPGDHVTAALPEAAACRVLRPQPMALEVLFEDEWLIAVNKPPGLIVHPSYRHPESTLVNALLWHARSVDAGCETPRLLYRLDKWTSGVIIAARSGQHCRSLLAAMRAADAEKAYLAVTYGGPRRSSGAIRLPLGHDPRDRRRIMASAGEGRSSLTRYRLLGRSRGSRRGLSLLECRLETGRTHQIRVHLSSSGWPIVGDPLYGHPAKIRLRDPLLEEVVSRFPRQALHARRVVFTHPFEGRRVCLEAAIPQDLDALLAASGLDGALAGP